MRADSLHHRLGAAVADGEAHPCPADQVEPPGRGSVQDGVAGDRLASRRSRQRSGSGTTVTCRRIDPWPHSRWPGRSGAVPRPLRRTRRTTVRLTAQLQADRSVQLAPFQGAGQAGAKRAIRRGQSRRPPASMRPVSGRRPRSPLRVGRRARGCDLVGARRNGPAGTRRRVQRPPPITGASSARADATGRRSRRLSPMISPTEPRPDQRQLAAQVFGDRGEEADDVVGRPLELGAQVLALGGDTGRTGIEMTLARHVAPDRHQCRRPECELLSAQQGSDQEVSTGLQTAVCSAAPPGRAGRCESASGGPRRDPAPTARRRA